MIMGTLWDKRYDTEDFIYGKEPNRFFAEQLQLLEPGWILLPAEGEGRNAVFAASEGWKVHAFDSSQVAQQKALLLAQQKQVHIRYDLHSSEGFHPGEAAYNVIALIYTHFPPAQRHSFFRLLQDCLAPGGKIILEGFRKDQIHRTSGGPKDLDMLFSVEELRHDFNKLHIEQLTAETIELSEGLLHKGTADVVRMVGRKKT